MSTGNKQKRVLLVMSSVDEMGVSGKHTGTWFTELAAPYYILTEAGYEVVLASPNGGEAPIDWLSMKAPFTTEYTRRFLSDEVALHAATVHHKRLPPMHAAKVSGLFYRGDVVQEGSPVHLPQRIGGVSTTGTAYPPAGFAPQRIASLAIGPSQGQYLVYPVLHQCRHAVPMHRGQPDNFLPAQQGLLLGLHINIEIGVKLIERAQFCTRLGHQHFLEAFDHA